MVTSVSVLARSVRWVGSDAVLWGLAGGDESEPAYKHQSIYLYHYLSAPIYNLHKEAGWSTYSNQIYLTFLDTIYLVINYLFIYL